MNVDYIMNKYNELTIYENYYNYKYSGLKKAKIPNELKIYLRNFKKRALSQNTSCSKLFNKKEQVKDNKNITNINNKISKSSNISVDDALNNPYLEKHLFQPNIKEEQNVFLDRINNKLNSRILRKMQEPELSPSSKSPYFFPWNLESKNQRIKEIKHFNTINKFINGWRKVRTIRNSKRDLDKKFMDLNICKITNDMIANKDSLLEDNSINKYETKSRNKLRSSDDNAFRNKNDIEKIPFHLCQKVKLEQFQTMNQSESKHSFNINKLYLTKNGSYPFNNYKKFTSSILYAINNIKSLPKLDDSLTKKSNQTIETEKTKLSHFFSQEKNMEIYKPKPNMQSELTKNLALIKYIEIERKDFDTKNIYIINKPLIPTIRAKIAKNMKKRYHKPLRIILSEEFVNNKDNNNKDNNKDNPLRNYFNKFGVNEYEKIYKLNNNIN